MGYATQHARALASLQSKGAPITFSKTTRPRDNTTGALGAPVTTSVSGYATELEAGDPATYAKLALTQSAAPSLFFVPTTMGDEPPPDSECVWGGVKYTARDVKPYRPDGVAIFATVVVAR